MSPFLPPRYEPIAFALLLSGIQSGIISGISTVMAVGWSADLLLLWGKAYLASWSIGFPGVLLIAPIVRRILKKITRPA